MSQGKTTVIRKVAVLGAGVMGAQIAAHMANADIPVVLFDLPKSDDDKNQIVNQSIQQLQKLKPAPFAAPEKISAIAPANYDDDLEKLQDCDLVIEAIAEKLEWKHDLYKNITPFISSNAILATNTSGLSINLLANVFDQKLAERFCVVHFFNPPRYMKLVELVPNKHTNPEILDRLETFLTRTLGKGVIRGKDTPNFVANRVGVFSMLATLHHTKSFGIPYHVVDKLTGTAIGRAKSATFRTIDVVGLDTLTHVINTMRDNLPDDPWHRYFGATSELSTLVEQGALGQKTGFGFYKKEGKVIKSFDPETKSYTEPAGEVSETVAKLLRIKDPVEKFQRLYESSEPQAQFIWACFRDLFHYCAIHLEDIAECARDLDLAIRWGFGWQEGPFETWQKADWQKIALLIQQDIAEGKAMESIPLPEWATAESFKGPHEADGSYSPESEQLIARSSLPVYKRQFYPDAVVGETYSEGETIHETDDVRLWTQGDGISILSFKSKLGTMGEGVLKGIQEAIAISENDFNGMVIWQRLGNYFSVGANLKTLTDYLQDNNFKAIESYIDNFQKTTMAVKYANIPVVGAVQGYALGGGCELMLHCSHVVSALETYAGLVELGVGLIPAGGGCAQMALRASQVSADPFIPLQDYFKAIAMGEVGASAFDVKSKGFLRETDTIIFNSNELLYVAKVQAQALAESNYRAPLKKPFKVAGDAGIATFQTQLINMLEGEFISSHDYFLAVKLAEVLCGGSVDVGTMVDEEWILHLEKQIFVELTKQEKSQERVLHMLKTGKPLRN